MVFFRSLTPVEHSERLAGCWAVRARANPLSLGVWHFTLRFVLPGSWVGHPSATAAERRGWAMQSPLGPKVYPKPRASFWVRRGRSSRRGIGSPGSVSSLEFRSRRLDPSGRSSESALAAVTSSTSTVIMCTPARSTPAALSQLTKPFSTRWKPSATRPACQQKGATSQPL